MSSNENTNLHLHSWETMEETAKELYGAFLEFTGGNLIESNTRPSMLLFELNGDFGRRWFGQKLPKNAVPVGVVDVMGRITLGEGVTLPAALEREVTILNSLHDTKSTFSFTQEEVAEAALKEILLLSANRRSGVVPPWAHRLGLALSLEQINALYQERTGRITDSVDVVVANFDNYDILDLAAWMVDHVDEVSDLDHARFLFTGDQFNGATWYRIIWVRMGQGETQLKMHQRLMMAAKLRYIAEGAEIPSYLDKYESLDKS